MFRNRRIQRAIYSSCSTCNNMIYVPGLVSFNNFTGYLVSPNAFPQPFLMTWASQCHLPVLPVSPPQSSPEISTEGANLIKLRTLVPLLLISPIFIVLPLCEPWARQRLSSCRIPIGVQHFPSDSRALSTSHRQRRHLNLHFLPSKIFTYTFDLSVHPSVLSNFSNCRACSPSYVLTRQC
ncbi:hypothetical protein BDP27DRAFT_443110 [Rhodocollybia butyracea]|uniref:Uncharacterized protein n=1 Tax=Rhodocollybia butyracea TaxID=206335 RepID=A0A9P5TZ35_9AGAR|nr:hypothetical protein BDP27DRAFT_443110 [Rhodocollybia butyracea]